MSDTVLLNKLYEATELNGMPDDVENDLEVRRSGQRASYFSELLNTAYGTQNDGPGTAVLFTALTRGCGVSYICSSIAVELAARGGKVLLADAEAIAALAGVPRPASCCERIEPGKVWVLGMKNVRAEGRTRLPGGGSATTALRLLQPEFSFVVIDAPTVSASEIALTLGAVTQGVVFVAQAGQTEKKKLSETQRKFSSLGARVLGSVLNAR